MDFSIAIALILMFSVLGYLLGMFITNKEWANRADSGETVKFNDKTYKVLHNYHYELDREAAEKWRRRNL